MTSAALVSLANHLWQSTLFTAAVWLVTLLLKSNAASVRHRLWLTASVKFLVPFSLLVKLGARLPLRTAPVASPRPVSVVVNAIGTPFPTITTINKAVGTLQPPERPSSRLPNALAALWFCRFVGCVGWWFLGWRQLRRALRRGVPLDLEGGGDIPVPVISSNERIEPGVFGVFRPVLLLPEGIAQQLTPDQLRAVVATRCPMYDVAIMLPMRSICLQKRCSGFIRWCGGSNAGCSMSRSAPVTRKCCGKAAIRRFTPNPFCGSASSMSLLP